MREEGKVKWFDAVKGFGFITRQDGTDLFVHFQDIKMPGYKTLNEGERVAYDVFTNSKGCSARNVERLDVQGEE